MRLPDLTSLAIPTASTIGRCGVFIVEALLLLLLLTLPATAAPPTVMVFGDSLSSGYGLARDAGWVSLLARRLKDAGLPHTVANASISGETTLGGKNRIAQALATHKPYIVIIELGGNDGLRGTPPKITRDNLAAIIDACRASGARALLVGVRVPPNYGMAYGEKFQAVYRDLAGKYEIPLVPFLLDGFGERLDMFQPDGIHPSAAAQPLMLENVWRKLEPMLSG